MELLEKYNPDEEEDMDPDDREQCYINYDRIKYILNPTEDSLLEAQEKSLLNELIMHQSWSLIFVVYILDMPVK